MINPFDDAGKSYFSQKEKEELYVLEDIRRQLGYDLIGIQLRERIDFLEGCNVPHTRDMSKVTFMNKLKCAVTGGHSYVAVSRGKGGHYSGEYTTYECDCCASDLRIYD